MNKRLFLFLPLVAAMVFQSSCTVPHRVMSQKDVLSRESNDPSLARRVLVASRSSEFKDRIVQRIEEALREEDVYVKVIGIEELDREDGSAYGAVVLINTCMVLEMDPKVHAFIERQLRTDHIIVLTTSGAGNWLPKEEGFDVDAVSAASKIYDADTVAEGILEKVRRLLE